MERPRKANVPAMPGKKTIQNEQLAARGNAPRAFHSPTRTPPECVAPSRAAVEKKTAPARDRGGGKNFVTSRSFYCPCEPLPPEVLEQRLDATPSSTAIRTFQAFRPDGFHYTAGGFLLIARYMQNQDRRADHDRSARRRRDERGRELHECHVWAPGRLSQIGAVELWQRDGGGLSPGH
jgi:hypothetical protein